MFEKDDPVAYRLWNREKEEWYEETGIVVGYHGKDVIVLFENDQKEYLCQERRLRKISANRNLMKKPKG